MREHPEPAAGRHVPNVSEHSGLRCLRRRAPLSARRSCRQRDVGGASTMSPSKLDTYKAKRRPDAHARADGGPAAPERGSRRTHIRRPGAPRPGAALGLPLGARRRARVLGAPQGRPARPEAQPPGRRRSRTTRSSTAGSPARSRGASTAAATVSIWDSGTYETEKWSEREVMVVLHGDAGERPLRAVQDRREELDDPPHGSGPRRRGSRCPSWCARCCAGPGTCRAARRGLDHRVQVGRGAGDRLRGRRPGPPRVAQRPRHHRRLPRAARARPGARVPAGDPRRRDRGVRRRGNRPSFGLLQQRMHVRDGAAARRLAAEDCPVSYLVFDVLHLDGALDHRSPLRASDAASSKSLGAGRGALGDARHPTTERPADGARRGPGIGARGRRVQAHRQRATCRAGGPTTG